MVSDDCVIVKVSDKVHCNINASEEASDIEYEMPVSQFIVDFLRNLQSIFILLLER